MMITMLRNNIQLLTTTKYREKYDEHTKHGMLLFIFFSEGRQQQQNYKDLKNATQRDMSDIRDLNAISYVNEPCDFVVVGEITTKQEKQMADNEKNEIWLNTSDIASKWLLG